MNRIIQGTDNGYPQSHYTKLTMDATKTKLIVYDDRSKDARPTETTEAQWPGWSYPAFNVTAHDGSGKSGEPGSTAITAVA